MACILIYVRMVLTVALALGIDAAVLWFYFRRVRPFMREVERKYLTDARRAASAPPLDQPCHADVLLELANVE